MILMEKTLNGRRSQTKYKKGSVNFPSNEIVCTGNKNGRSVGEPLRPEGVINGMNIG
jgi:hypothetical protein